MFKKTSDCPLSNKEAIFSLCGTAFGDLSGLEKGKQINFSVTGIGKNGIERSDSITEWIRNRTRRSCRKCWKPRIIPRTCSLFPIVLLNTLSIAKKSKNLTQELDELIEINSY